MGGKAKKRAKRDLTPKQRRFVEEYLVDTNATQAAIRAGYSPKTAEQIGYKLVQKSSVQATIQRAMDARGARTGITQDRVLKELELLAFSDVRNYVIDKNGDVRVADGAPEGATRALSSLKKRIIKTGSGKNRTTTIETEVKLWDKPGQVKLAGRHTSVRGFADKIEVSGSVTIADLAALAEDANSDEK